MKVIYRTLRKLDFFGVPFSFRYNKKEKFTTPLGGFLIILFTIISLYLCFYNLMAFIDRDNFAIVYYTMNIPKTEGISLKSSNAALAFGYDCSSYGRFKADDVFDIEVRYIAYSKTLLGEYVKDKQLLSTHSCRHGDFYNLHNNQFDYLNLPKYRCLDDNTHIIQGIWNDQIFTYYEISVLAKNQTKENLDNIEEYLFENDCKFQFFYTDITIDLYNYKHPIDPYLNGFFIQLNPTLFIKRNIYFMNQYLSDDDYLFGIIKNFDNNVKRESLFSRYEEYFLYLGLNRSITNPPNLYNYAKVYVRADTKKTDIRRSYQKLMEFYANTTSLLIGIFRKLIIIFNFINEFYAENSIIKRIFFLKEIDDNTHFNIFKMNKKIKELESLTDLSSVTDSNFDSFETTLKDIFSIKKHELKTYDNKSQKHIRINNDYRTNTFYILGDKNDSEFRKIKSINSGNDINSSSRANGEERKDIPKNCILNLNKEKISKENIKVENIQKKNLTFTFNIFEIIISSFCKCCITKELTLKKNINNKATELLYNKLDIVTYIRNMILLDVINEILLGDDKKDIFNFISRPLLSIQKDEKYNNSQFYQHYNENDFNKFYNAISEIMQKSEKKEIEKNLIILVNKNLKEFL